MLSLYHQLADTQHIHNQTQNPKFTQKKKKKPPKCNRQSTKIGYPSSEVQELGRKYMISVYTILYTRLAVQTETNANTHSPAVTMMLY